ncbi:MAG: hypothetical protein ACXQTZ_02240 [Candidatus Alkanophagales archaeon]
MFESRGCGGGGRVRSDRNVPLNALEGVEKPAIAAVNGYAPVRVAT